MNNFTKFNDCLFLVEIAMNVTENLNVKIFLEYLPEFLLTMILKAQENWMC